MEDLLVGDGEPSLGENGPFSVLNWVAVLRPCQKSRGDESPPVEALNGDDWNGEESLLAVVGFFVV